MKLIRYSPKTEELEEIEAKITVVEWDRNAGSKVDNAVLIYTDTEWYISLDRVEWSRVNNPGVRRKMTRAEAGQMGGRAPGAKRGRKPRVAE